MMKLSMMLKAARVKKGMTTVEAAQSLSMTPCAYNRYENGKIKNPHILTLRKMAEFAESDISEIVSAAFEENN